MRGLAEDLAQEALLTALERWREMGIPDNPGAWLMATAKNRAIDQLRQRQMRERQHGAVQHDPSMAGLMREGRLPLAQIALECGFHDQAHFTQAFRKVLGTTPVRSIEQVSTRRRGRAALASTHPWTEG
jgi:DNA-directed RNA polymerase specialized sigma24 family protein